jgi:glycosyltransferase involved in cell wall biosynthesis
MAGIKAYRIRPGQAVCIYNVIDLSRFENLENSELVAYKILGRDKKDSFIAVMVAAFEKRKDYPTMIDAAITSCHKWPEIIFLLIGEGSQLEEMRRKVPVELLDTRILFLGNRNNVESILQIADVGLLITPSEGLSNSIIEYMALAKPVIASKGGGVEELVKDRWNGFLVDQSSPDQIVQALGKLRMNSALRANMGENGRKWVYENLDSKRITKAYIDIYWQLLAKD